MTVARRSVRAPAKVLRLDPVGKAVKRLDDLMQQEADLKDEIADARQNLQALMSQNEIKTKTVRLDDGSKATVHVLWPDEEVIDERMLRRRLGSRLWNLVSTRSMDKRKLAALIKSKEVDPNVVAQCSETRHKTKEPYIQLRRHR